MTKRFMLAVLTALALGASACGGGSGPTSPGGNGSGGGGGAPPPPAKTILYESREFICEPGGGGVQFIRQVDLPGRIEALMTWTPAPPAGEGLLAVYKYYPDIAPVNDSRCWQAEASRCYLFLISDSDPLGKTSRSITFRAAAGERFSFYYANAGKQQSIHGFASAYLYPDAQQTSGARASSVEVALEPLPVPVVPREMTTIH